MVTALLADRYTLHEKLGQGETTEVYRATDTLLGRPVAVKVLRADLLWSESARERLAQEAAVATLAHPDIIQVFDRGTAPHPADPAHSAPYIVTEYVDGTTLEGLAEGGLPAESARPIMDGVLQALDAAHREGIIHGNPSPANVLVSRAGAVKMANFTVAGPLDLRHAAPEVAAGGQPTVASDLYAASSMFRAIARGTTPEADAVLLKGLSADPAERWASAAEMRAALEAAGVAPERESEGVNRRTAALVLGAVTAGVLGLGAYGLTRVLPGSESAGQRVLTIPAVKGLTQAEAEQRLKDARIKYRLSSVQSGDVPSGRAASTSPAEGQTIDPQDSIVLSISTGPGHAVLPASLIGAREEDARSRLEQLGMKVGEVLKQNSPDRPAGEVLKVSPPVGSDVATGTRVVLTVSTGQLAVPNVVGLSESAAASAITQAGLKVRVQYGYSSLRGGLVFSQSPAASTSVSPGAEVTLSVSSTPAAPSPAPSPSSSPSSSQKSSSSPSTSGTPSPSPSTKPSASPKPSKG